MVILAGAAVGVVGRVWERRYAEHVLPGVTIGGAAVGGLDRAAATMRVEALARPALDRALRLRGGSEAWTRPARLSVLKCNRMGLVDAPHQVGGCAASGWWMRRIRLVDAPHQVGGCALTRAVTVHIMNSSPQKH
jgi:hypothetical protein